MRRGFTVYGVLAVVLMVTGYGTGYPTQDKSNIEHADSMTSSSELQPEIKSPQSSSSADDSDMFLEAEQKTEQTRLAEQQTEKVFTPSELVGGSQTFFPSFSIYNNQPLGHSRPFVYQQEAAYSQRPAAYRQQLNYDNGKFNNPFRRENFQPATDAGHGILGSGNFAVIRGGTFYGDNDGEASEYTNTGRYNNYSPFYHNNGHGRPTFYFGASNPRPQQHEQFANFRDFADINTPNPAYSEYVVVYINKNGTRVENEPRKAAEPKNIIERLAMLDLEGKKPKDPSPPKKLSAAKRKLALLPPEKKVKGKKTTTTPPTDLLEPLLALS